MVRAPGKNKIHKLIANRKLCLTVDQGQSKKGGGGSPVHLMRIFIIAILEVSMIYILSGSFDR